MKTITFLDKEISLPFTFLSKLSFGEEEVKKMPWLRDSIRYYTIEKEIGKGGRSTAYKGFVSDSFGNPLSIETTIVLKIPNLDTQEYTGEEIKEYLSKIKDECGKEWQLTRARLRTCKYANPIFDFFCYSIDYMDLVVDLPITAQLFLNGPVTLDNYLIKIGQKIQPYISDRVTSPNNWRGMNDPSKWINIARCLAIGLADIHQRRVVHGDVWPPNIFISEDENGAIYPIFIDFGEAFPIEPRGDSRHVGDHPYRAPERKDAQNIVTKAADVYSYGKLLLNLAVGEEPIIPREFKGYERRKFIKEKFFDRNPGLVENNPFIIDVICNCVAFDSVDRPSMDDVLRALNSYVDYTEYSSRAPEVLRRITSLNETWIELTSELQKPLISVGPFLQEIIDQRLSDIQDMIKGLKNDVIILNDTREKLILAMVGLFLRMKRADRFISITNIAMWQGAALGLDGRYFTATKLAVKNEASIQRSFIFSVQEVGSEWASSLCYEIEKLNKKSNNRKADMFIRSLKEEIRAYNGFRELGDVRDVGETSQKYGQKQLKLIIKSYFDASKDICRDLFDTSDRYESFEKSKGMYLGLIPVSTNASMRLLKSAHPVSVFFYNDAPVNDQYLLMMTECHARNSNSDLYNEASRPELRGLMVFKSVLGVPGDRIKKIQHVFKQQSINIGGWIDILYQAVNEVENKVIE